MESENDDLDHLNYSQTSVTGGAHHYGASVSGGDSTSHTLLNSTAEAAPVQPEPQQDPADPEIISQNTAHVATPFSFEQKLGIQTPKVIYDAVMNPVPQGKKFMCRIVRMNNGVDKKLFPSYDLWLEEPSDGSRVFLLSATKKKRGKGSYYSITSDQHRFSDESAGSDQRYGVLGKLRSNFLGTAFSVYSNGRNPFTTTSDVTGAGSNVTSLEAAESKAKEADRSSPTNTGPIRQELGSVIYSPNVLGLKGPRKMTILMNIMSNSGDLVESRPVDIKDTLIGRYTANNTDEILVLRNKSPQWNDETNSFVLNFGGRVSLASVKNFQIIHDDDLDYIILQFGRVSNNTFTMDCQYPVTPFQAFAFALTSFDAKLACE